MSTMTLRRPKPAGAPGRVPLPRAQVNLLPQHVRDARRVGAARRLLGLGLIGLLALGAVGYGAVVYEGHDAADQLAAAQTESARLAAEENKYAEVPQVKAKAAQVKVARIAATSLSEILWQPVLASFTASLPSGTTVQTLTVKLSEPTTTKADPLAVSGVASLQFTARSETVPDVAAWMDSLAAVPGFTDVRISAATQADDQGHTYYDVQGTLQLSDALLAHRFDQTGGK
ncbi:MAG: PilN domain-containing protein [Actinobacteria bacterium]|nr:PilN domain-containing protein [Actinomycetota bacterium]MCG2803447.1 PilN domain-containing protein [Cellulomonas sp.]